MPNRRTSYNKLDSFLSDAVALFFLQHVLGKHLRKCQMSLNSSLLIVAIHSTHLSVPQKEHGLVPENLMLTPVGGDFPCGDWKIPVSYDYD